VTEADGSVVTYGYDGLLHLSSEERTGSSPYSASYTVDGAGQRTSETVGGVTTTFTYDADAELLSTAGGFVNSYVYDLDGEQTSRKLSGVTTALTWDFDNQLLSAGSASFTYDAGGRRMTRTAGGVTTSFLYDGASVLLEKQGTTTTGRRIPTATRWCERMGRRRCSTAAATHSSCVCPYPLLNPKVTTVC
jgi:uncharacterized protein RhaS with RHS repeats